MPHKRTHYNEEFKKNTLHLLTTNGKSRLALETDLGLSHGLLYKREQRYQVNPTTETLERACINQEKETPCVAQSYYRSRQYQYGCGRHSAATSSVRRNCFW